jgi:hypothetical protein
VNVLSVNVLAGRRDKGNRRSAGDARERIAGERCREQKTTRQETTTMSILVKAVLASTVISAASAAELKADPYCCPHPAICDAICSSPCCPRKRTSKLLVPVLTPASVAVH